MRILVAGISGFVGRQLAPLLRDAGHEVVGLSRDPSRVSADLPVIRGDSAAGIGLDEALDGVDVAYYLVHSLETGNDEGYVARDRRSATNFASAARRHGVKRIVYCGVLEPPEGRRPSKHIESRHMIEHILLEHVTDTVSLRTWFIVSAENQFLRYMFKLIEGGPILLLPPWRSRRVQPVDGRDVAAALAGAASSEAVGGRILDISGDDVLTWEEVFERAAAKLEVAPRTVRLPFNVPARMGKMAAQRTGEDPELIVPVMRSLECGDVLPRRNSIRLLGIEPRSFEESLTDAVAEWRSGGSGTRQLVAEA